MGIKIALEWACLRVNKKNHHGVITEMVLHLSIVLLTLTKSSRFFPHRENRMLILIQTNNNLSKRLLVGDNIASADLLNDNPAERFGTLSMRFSDGAINQLLLLKDTAVVTILRNNVWAEQYRFATTSMLSDYILKSGIKFIEQYLKSTQILSPSGTTLLNDASITIPFDCIAILTWKLHCKSSEQKASLYYMVNKAYVQGRHQWDGTIQTDETVNIFAMGRFSKDQELTVSVQGNCSVVGNNTSLTRYSFVFIPI